MRKFTDEQVADLRVILETECGKDISLEEAAMAAHNLYELYEALSYIARKSSE